MSDYVSRLVARSMGAASVVRPETASLFEPRDAAPQQLLAEVDVETSGQPRAAPGEPHAPAVLADDSPVVRADALAPVPSRDLSRDVGARAAEAALASPPLKESVESPGLETPVEAGATTAILVRAASRERRPASAAPGTLSMRPPISPAPAPEEPPVVLVTIGRVHVRAVQSAPPAPAAPPRDRATESPPRQTLGEYLRKGARP